MTCPSCGAENRPGRKFCAECGSPLALACPSCGAANEPGERFCGECGTELETAPTAPAPREPAAERRLVSVLFADLVGFTAASEARDAEETRELLSRYFDSCNRLISLYGGTVEKFIGDAVMAVWGTPTATEDDAERAVRAALDLVAAVSALGDEVGSPELRARAGVMTGEAAVTLAAAGEGMVAGDLVNTASRVQSVAPAGGVYVGDATRRATEQAIVYEDAGLHELKGKEGLVPLWRALRVISGARGALKSAGLEAPFVGRDRELRLIKDLFHASADENKAHLVSVVGIAGLGKSRLAWEYFKYIDGLPQLTYWHRGRCLSYGEGVTYWALADMVRMRARIAEDEEPASAFEKLRAVVEEHFAEEEERRFVEPRLAHLLGLEERSGYEREDLFAAWRLFFERLADVNPTVLVFEDMQWADAALLDFVEHLLEWSRNHRIYVITMARPELIERRPTWGGGRRNFTSIYLEPLPPPAMEELLAGLVPGLPGELRRQILERAEGVPLYAVETVRMLLDRGLLVQEGSVYRPAGTIEALEVPETLQALIAARLDGLPPEERRLVQEGAVLGKTFTKRGLAALSQRSEAELEPLLVSLVRREVLSIQADPRSPEHGQYGFLQDLVRHVAYETLAKRERRSLHLAAAAYLESAFRDEEEIVEVVASHYLEAYRAAPEADDAGEIKTKAREMLAGAGERAASLGAGEEARRYFEQAAELADEPLTKAELLERAGEMAWSRGQGADAKAHFENAIATFESAGRTHAAARVSAALAEVAWQEGHLEEGLARMEQAFEILSRDEPDADFATLAAQLGRLLYFNGRPEDAAARIEVALETAELLRLPEVIAQSLNTKSLILSAQGRREEARALLGRALEVALEHDRSNAAIRAYNNTAALVASLDLHDEEIAQAEGGLEVTRRVGNRMWERRFLAGMIGPLFFLGRWHEAVAIGEEFLEEEDAPATVGGMIELLSLAAVYAERGNLVGAHRLFEKFPGSSAEDVQLRAAYNGFLARVLRAEGDLQAALQAAEAAFEARTEIGMMAIIVKDGLVEVLEAAFQLGDTNKIEELLGLVAALRPGESTPYLQAQGTRFAARLGAIRGEDVGAGFTSAAEAFGDLKMPFHRAVVQLEHAEWLTEQGRGEEAEALLSEAREAFERLEATPWLERLGHAGRIEAEAIPAGS